MLLRTLTIFACIISLGGTAQAFNDEDLDGRIRLLGERIAFDIDGRYTNYVLVIAGPEGYQARAEGARSAPTLRLADHGDVPDGRYRYSLTAATDRIDPSTQRVDHAANGREPGAGVARIGASLSGSFVVEDGRLRIFEDLEEPQPGDG